MDNFAGLGLRIMESRLNKDMTREKLAEKLDVSVNFVYQIEKGIKAPSLANFYNLCRVLEVSADYLLFGFERGSKDEMLKLKILETFADCTEEDIMFLSDVSRAYKKSRSDDGR